jgi:hypothetical protein
MLRKLASLCLAITLAAPSAFPPQSLLDHITAAGIRAHMAFLADDLLEGRGTGTRGYQLAANYVRSQFEQLGLEPAGENGTYFQNVKLRQVQTIGARDLIALKRANLSEIDFAFEKDFLMFGDAARELTEASGPMVFAGYGVTAPDQHYDDFAGIDAKGKIIIVASGAPPTFPSSERAYYSDDPIKLRNAAAHGAIGCITIWIGPQTKNTPFSTVVSYSHQPIMYWLDKNGTPNDYVPEIRGEALITEEAGALLLAGSPHTLAEAYASISSGKPLSFDMPYKLFIREAAKFTPLESPNIAAVLPGSDPSLKNEYVVLSAHVDHVGIGDAVNGDTIYNGAMDNASGTAALLEMAKVFAESPEKPKRSVMFLAVTGEEAGLLGSDYFAHFPTVPIKQIAANVNMDGISLLYEFKDIVALGAEHSTLLAPVEDAAHHLGLELSPDPMPEEGFFIRSDQYSFVKQGVPAVNISEGFKTVDPSLDGAKITADWIRTRYHTPQDDMQQPLNFKAARLDTQVIFAVAYEIANTPVRPQWNKGDMFGDRFGKK